MDLQTFFDTLQRALLVTDQYPAPWELWTRQQYDEWCQHVRETRAKGGIPKDATAWLATFYPNSPVFKDPAPSPKSPSEPVPETK